LSFLFEKIYCISYNQLCFKKFNPKIKRNDIRQLINRDFSFESYDSKFIDFINDIYDQMKFVINTIQLLIDNKVELYLTELINYCYDMTNINNKKFIEDANYNNFFINKFNKIKIKNQIINIKINFIDPERKFINKIINKYKLYNCLEIGLSHGIYAFYILSNKNVKRLISIDSFQEKQWYNGINFLTQFNLIDRHILYEDKPYVTFPKILNKYNKKTFDLIFINSLDIFNYTIIDLFFCNLLLKVDGIIIINDALHKGVQQYRDYIEKNYPSYKKIKSPNTLFACIKKK
jgi:predicted O-methyltransferase YrrM